MHYPIVIDRPLGTVKKFLTPDGTKKKFVYPLNYGYYSGLINPQDNGEADIFIGNGGTFFGRFAKRLHETDTKEFKWFKDCNLQDLIALVTFCTARQLIITDIVFFSNEHEIIDDINKLIAVK